MEYVLASLLFFLFCMGLFHIIHLIWVRFKLTRNEGNLVFIIFGFLASFSLKALTGEALDLISAFVIIMASLYLYDWIQVRYFKW